jgi:hypothetical protein
MGVESQEFRAEVRRDSEMQQLKERAKEQTSKGEQYEEKIGVLLISK